MKPVLKCVGYLVAIVLLNDPFSCLAQVEMEGWGNVNGIRVEGQLMEFETSIKLIYSDSTASKSTAKERQRPIYHRKGLVQSVTTRIDSLYLNILSEDLAPGSAEINVSLDSHADTALIGVYFCIRFPHRFYGPGTIDSGERTEPVASVRNKSLNLAAESLNISSESRQLLIQLPQKQNIYFSSDTINKSEDLLLYIPLAEDSLISGQQASLSIKVWAQGEADHSTGTLTIDSKVQGRKFDGLGGNFRLQNPKTDPPVINYSLENLRVAWARVELPWIYWHQQEHIDPLEAARKGELHPRVQAAMEMAQRLHQLEIPVMVAIWGAPEWAIIGERRFGPRPGGLRGNPLNQFKRQRIYQSIAGYMIFMKEKYGVEAQMFSFNESDLGIYVRQTPEEHTQLIKELGAYFASNGLETKLLLGDTADANGWPFIEDAMNDPETLPYIGAVSFHSWRGWSHKTLSKWDEAADKLDIPLVVGEGSIDAAAWRFPKIFEEPTYARAEINLYVRILAICQPKSILQWQLTADYSLMSGGGVFGNHQEPLRPTQRFWNLKQLASTPKGVAAWGSSMDKKDISAAVLGDLEAEIMVVHLVNNAASRPVVLEGIPDGISRLRAYVTNHEQDMEQMGKVKVRDGRAELAAPAVSYITLTTEKFHR